jgi:hypothetical protein
MKFLTNTQMAVFLAAHLKGTIPKNVFRWLEKAGFVAREGCVFLDILYEGRGNATASHFPDETGYECYINHIHLDAHTTNCGLLAAIALMYAIDHKWRESDFGGNALQHIISADQEAPDECVYRCHVIRPNQTWLATNLDTYSQLLLLGVTSGGSKP